MIYSYLSLVLHKSITYSKPNHPYFLITLYTPIYSPYLDLFHRRIEYIYIYI